LPEPAEASFSVADLKRERRLSIGQVAERARRELVEMTGLEPEGVTSIEPDDDGMWKVTLELLELSRIPPTDDVLGTYEAVVDPSGELLGYRRVRRYARSRLIQDQGSW
jgi:hypothetical protein